MLSYSQSLSLYQKLTNNTETANTNLFNIIFNEHNRMILSKRDWSFLESTATIDTVASQQFYDLPYNVKKVINATILVGTNLYSPCQITSKVEWDRLNTPTSTTSDYPSYYFIFNDQIGFWQTPTTASNTIRINYRERIKDLTVVDYTTGTITTATNGSATITGNGTTWTNKMNGRWIRITDSDTANTGDGEWYKIDTVASTTSLTLVDTYQGTSIATGSATYTIGQISQIPEDYQIIPVYMSVSDYWAKELNANLSQKYENLANIKLNEMIDAFSEKTDNPIVYERVGQIINPNLTLDTIT